MINTGDKFLIGDDIYTFTGRVIETLPEQYELEDESGNIQWYKEDYLESRRLDDKKFDDLADKVLKEWEDAFKDFRDHDGWTKGSNRW